ncbi:MAG: hypothetical protein OCD76_07405 [Reichenbachiella sp.]
MKLPSKEDFKKLYNPNGTFSFNKMFWEMGSPESRKVLPPIFTLKMEAHKDLPSAYQIYMDSIDEYDAAQKLAPNMKVWDALVECNWFREGEPRHAHDGLKVWRQHMKARDASLAKKLLLEQTREGNTTAARALLAESKTKAPVGRKTKKATEVDAPTVTRMQEFKDRKGR